MKKNIYYSLLISAMVSVSVAEETRQVDKHEHGVGELNIAIEGNAIDFEFFIPGADIVGFEYEAKTESDIALVNAALEKFGNFDNIFSLPESSNCNLVNSDINILMEKNDYKLISKFGVTCFYTQKENLKRIQDIMNIQ